MGNDIYIQKVKDEWNNTADSEWHMSYRKEDVIKEILQAPKSFFIKKHGK